MRRSTFLNSDLWILMELTLELHSPTTSLSTISKQWSCHPKFISTNLKFPVLKLQEKEVLNILILQKITLSTTWTRWLWWRKKQNSDLDKNNQHPSVLISLWRIGTTEVKKMRFQRSLLSWRNQRNLTRSKTKRKRRRTRSEKKSSANEYRLMT